MMRIKYLLVILLLSLSLSSATISDLTLKKIQQLESRMNISEIELPPELINLDTRTFNDRSMDAGIREAIEYPDTNDYYDHPICGNKPLPSLLVAECFCGTETLSGAGDLALGDSFCCVSPEDECYENGRDVTCPNGIKQSKSKPCYGQCYNSYTTSKYLSNSASLWGRRFLPSCPASW